MFEYSLAEVAAQLEALPLGIVLWVCWLSLANVASLFFKNFLLLLQFFH